MKLKSFKSKLTVCIILLIGALSLYIYKRMNYLPFNNYDVGPAYLTANAIDLKKTIVTPHLEQDILPGKNILWCATMQLAWNELYDINKGPINLVPRCNLADILNRRTTTKGDLDKNSYVAMAGYIEDGIVQRISKELDQRFYGQQCPELLRDLQNKDGILTYGYMSVALPFELAFTREKTGLKFQGKAVESFTSSEYKSAKQVTILDGMSDDDFIIELKTKQMGDRIIMAKIKPLSTLQETISLVQKRMKSGLPSELTASQPLQVPILNFDIFKGYPELSRHNIQSSVNRLNGQDVLVAAQTIRFRLDENGAVLRSEMLGGPGCRSHGPQHIYFDKPFLIMLQRKDAENPYFALWVGNIELLMPVKSKKR